MLKAAGRENLPVNMGNRRIRAILLWLAVATGLAVSVFTLIEELCLATACSDAASFTFFGVGIGWLGVGYFSLVLLMLWLRQRFFAADRAFGALVYTGVGAELRLLWIQKYVIGSWCPLCVTICSALFVAAVLLLIEKIQGTGSETGRKTSLPEWLAFVMLMVAAGAAIAFWGVRALM